MKLNYGKHVSYEQISAKESANGGFQSDFQNVYEIDGILLGHDKYKAYLLEKYKNTEHEAEVLAYLLTL